MSLPHAAIEIEIGKLASQHSFQSGHCILALVGREVGAARGASQPSERLIHYRCQPKGRENDSLLFERRRDGIERLAATAGAVRRLAAPAVRWSVTDQNGHP